MYNAIYCDRTIRYFKVRTCEHLSITFLAGKKSKGPKESDIVDHILLAGHNPSFNEFETLVKESNEFRFLLRESILTSHDEPSLKKYVKPLKPLELFT